MGSGGNLYCEGDEEMIGTILMLVKDICMLIMELWLIRLLTLNLKKEDKIRQVKEEQKGWH